MGGHGLGAPRGRDIRVGGGARPGLVVGQGVSVASSFHGSARMGETLVGGADGRRVVAEAEVLSIAGVSILRIKFIMGS